MLSNRLERGVARILGERFELHRTGPGNFGLLAGFTIIAAFLADLILAPALRALVIRPPGVEAAAALEMETSR